MISIVIVDDEPLARLRLKQVCDDLNDERSVLNLPNSVIGEFASAIDLSGALPKLSQSPCVLLLDIHMPGLDGMEVARYIHANTQNIHIIFTTATPEYALEAFEISAIDYLLKPIRLERLRQALQKIPSPQDSDNNEVTDISKATIKIVNLAVSSLEGGSNTSVLVNEVIAFKAQNKQTLVFTQTMVYSSNLALNELEQTLRLTGFSFIRVHRNALVRHSAIEKLQMNSAGEVFLCLHGMALRILVSRRMLSTVKSLLAAAKNT